MGRASYLDRAGFGARAAVSVVATVLLVLAGRVHGAAGLALPAGQPDVVRFAVHLDVIVDGRRVTVPPGIGARGRLTADLYPSDGSGIIHVVSDDDQSVFTLGQFFDKWQVTLTPEQLGGLHASSRDPVTVYLDGSRVAGYAFPAGT